MEGQQEPVWSTQVVDEVPSALQPATVYVVGGLFPWCCVFLCPCGCGGRCHLSLVEGHSPRWRIEHHQDGTVTLTPSVLWAGGCRSHFFVRQGRIVWCG